MVRVIRNDRKYSLIRPFWFDTIIEEEAWNLETDLGRMFSIQVKSNNMEDNFWLINRLDRGNSR